MATPTPVWNQLAELIFSVDLDNTEGTAIAKAPIFTINKVEWSFTAPDEALPAAAAWQTWATAQAQKLQAANPDATLDGALPILFGGRSIGPDEPKLDFVNVPDTDLAVLTMNVDPGAHGIVVFGSTHSVDGGYLLPVSGGGGGGGGGSGGDRVEATIPEFTVASGPSDPIKICEVEVTGLSSGTGEVLVTATFNAALVDVENPPTPPTIPAGALGVFLATGDTPADLIYGGISVCIQGYTNLITVTGGLSIPAGETRKVSLRALPVADKDAGNVSWTINAGGEFPSTLQALLIPRR